MTIPNILLLITFAINLVMSIVLFRRSSANKAVKYFAWTLMFTAWWGLMMFLFRYLSTSSYALLAMTHTCTFGLLLTHMMLLFVNQYPFASDHISKIKQTVLSVLSLIVISIVVLDPNFATIHGTDRLFDVSLRSSTFFVFSIYLSYLFFEILRILLQKIRISTGIQRRQLIWVFFGISLAMFSGLTFNVLLVFGMNFYNNWLGPVSSLVMNGIILKMLFGRK